MGEYIIDVCHGTACHVAGAVQITEALEEELGVADGKTTKDMKFTLSSVACMGACSQAPVMRIGEQTYGGLTPDKTRKIIRDLMRRGRRRERVSRHTMADDITTTDTEHDARNVRVAERPAGGYRVTVCAGTACVFAGSLAVHDAFVAGGRRRPASATRVEVSIIGCHGLCSMSPVVVLSDDTLYGHLRPQDVGKVVEEHLKGGAPVEKFLYKDAQTGERIRDWHDIGFYKQQTRIALRDVGVIDPGEHRRVPRARRLRGRAHGAHREDARVDHRAGHRLGHPRPRRRRLPHGRQVEVRQPGARATRSTSSATPTRATPARSWTAPSSRATRTPSSRA